MRLAAAALFAALLAGSGFAAAQTTAPATSAPASTMPAARKPAMTSATTPAATGAPMSAGADEASAKQKCGSDPVVWGNPSSKAYHTAGSRYFGKTKKGMYICMKDATAAGFHAAGAKHAKKPAGSSS